MEEEDGKKTRGLRVGSHRFQPRFQAAAKYGPSRYTRSGRRQIRARAPPPEKRPRPQTLGGTPVPAHQLRPLARSFLRVQS